MKPAASPRIVKIGRVPKSLSKPKPKAAPTTGESPRISGMDMSIPTRRSHPSESITARVVGRFEEVQ